VDEAPRVEEPRGARRRLRADVEARLAPALLHRAAARVRDGAAGAGREARPRMAEDARARPGGPPPADPDARPRRGRRRGGARARTALGTPGLLPRLAPGVPRRHEPRGPR